MSSFPALPIRPTICGKLGPQLQGRAGSQGLPAPEGPRPRPYLAPQKGLDAALMRAVHDHAGTLGVFVFLKGKEEALPTWKHTPVFLETPPTSPRSPRAGGERSPHTSALSHASPITPEELLCCPSLSTEKEGISPGLCNLTAQGTCGCRVHRRGRPNHGSLSAASPPSRCPTPVCRQAWPCPRPQQETAVPSLCLVRRRTDFLWPLSLGFGNNASQEPENKVIYWVFTVLKLSRFSLACGKCG